MGMTNDNIERESLIESKPEPKKEAVKKGPYYNVFGLITIKDKEYCLYSGVEDHRWYKAPKIGEYPIDSRNRWPIMPIFGKIEPITEDDWK